MTEKPKPKPEQAPKPAPKPKPELPAVAGQSGFCQ